LKWYYSSLIAPTPRVRGIQKRITHATELTPSYQDIRMFLIQCDPMLHFLCSLKKYSFIQINSILSLPTNTKHKLHKNSVNIYFKRREIFYDNKKLVAFHLYSSYKLVTFHLCPSYKLVNFHLGSSCILCHKPQDGILNLQWISVLA